jgi:TusA-related sulfurtransferase
LVGNPRGRQEKEISMSAEAEAGLPMTELDLRGNVCPGPTADTLEALKTLPPGGKLAVVTDYLPARQTIPRLVEQRGCTWRMTEDDGQTFRLEIVKGGG